MSWLLQSVLQGIVGLVARAPDAAPEPAPRASEPAFELVWSPRPQCPDKAAVLAMLDRHLGRPIGDTLGRGMRVALEVTRHDDGGWQSTIAFSGPDGVTQRELGDATDCTRAVEAASLVIAIAIDPSLVFGPTPQVPKPEPPEPEPTPAPEPIATPTPTPTPSTAPPERPPVRGAIGIAAGPSFGELPRVGALARLHAAAFGRRWRVELGGLFAGAPPAALEVGSIAVVRWSVDARGCAVLGGPRFEVLPCAGIEAGRAVARSRGVDDTRRRGDPWLAAIASARLVWVVAPRAGLFVQGDVVAPIVRQRYEIRGLGTVHRPTPVTGALVAGVEVRFP